jgi:hypothetical protein
MRKTLALTVLILGVLSGAVTLGLTKSTAKRGRLPAATTPSSAEEFVVHEWGTFTNFAGSDGVQLEFRPIVDGELPGFVYDRARFANQRIGDLLSKSRPARQRMETPVTYFYVDRARDVEVRVGFPHGLLTEFFPPVKSMLPEYQPLERPTLEHSVLDWGRVRLVPSASFAKLHWKFADGTIERAELPKVEGDNHYAYARETDSAVVEVMDQRNRTYYEKFLFYRGLGDFSLPLRFSALGEGRFSVENDGPEAVKDLFLVHIEGEQVRYCHTPQVEAHGAASLDEPESDSTIEALSEELVQALSAAGLFEKEARAMVKTWRSSWFGESGTRLLYLVPASLTDELLPLEVKPAPDRLVRVLVGRMEVLTPEESVRLLKLVREAGPCLSLQTEPLRSELTRLGRFAEPVLRLLADSAEGEYERAQIEGVLSAVRAGGPALELAGAAP